MPDPAFLKMYRDAMTRDCPAIWHCFQQRDIFGSNDWLQMVVYADALVELGESFIDNINHVAKERGLIDEHTRAQVCPRCGRESCPGAAYVLRTTVTAVEIHPDS